MWRLINEATKRNNVMSDSNINCIESNTTTLLYEEKEINLIIIFVM